MAQAIEDDLGPGVDISASRDEITLLTAWPRRLQAKTPAIPMRGARDEECRRHRSVKGGHDANLGVACFRLRPFEVCHVTCKPSLVDDSASSAEMHPDVISAVARPEAARLRA